MDNKEKWKQVLKEEKIGDIGIQLIAGADRIFLTDYGINSTSYFILIDPEGKIVEAAAQKPSDPKLIKLFDKTLGL
jgi:cytochrome oxidase Cu insertion factor (SCO1/SenC/PrrC family)